MFLKIPGYELQTDLRRDREDTRNGVGGGLLVYAKTGVNILSLDNEVNFNQYCTFKVGERKEELQVYLVYRSPNAPEDQMEKLVELVNQTERSSILLGDFNLPVIDWTEGTAAGPAARSFLEACMESNLEQLVTFPTHVRGNTLDLLLTNMSGNILEVSDQGRLGNSDHTMILVTVETEKRSIKSVERVPNWSKADWTALKREARLKNWTRTIRGLTAREAWGRVKHDLVDMVSTFVPKKLRRNPNRPPWMNQQILREIRRRKRLWRTHKDSARYEDQSRMVKQMIRNAKRKLERRLAEGGGNNRPFYSYVRNRTKNRAGVGPLKEGAGQLVSDSKEMADMLNRYFSSVFTSERDEPPVVQEMFVRNRLENITVTAKKVREKILALKPDSAPGPDGLTGHLLQGLVDEVSPVLAQIFSKSLEEGEVPADWRSANVTPIFKKGARTKQENYRPVSLTSIPCKIMESIVRDGLMAHLEENSLMNPSQHGFMPGKSCATNLLEFLEFVTQAVDEGKNMDIVFLDFAKAFDKVPKERLLAKLAAHGVGGQVIQWVRAWLTDRTQKVVLNGEASEPAAVESGVPQGSVLGPILFDIFINDIDLLAALIDILRKFADDTKLGKIIASVEDSEVLQDCLNMLVDWADKWGMSFNTGKCKVMHVGSSNQKAQYTMAGAVLGTTETERDIGVLVSDNMKPGKQCQKAAQTASSVLGQISRAFHYRDRITFVKLYKQYVRPHLEFAVTAWSPWTEADKECLEKVQRRAVKMISGLTSNEYIGRLAELGMETLEERRHRMDMAQVYKIVTGKDRVKSETWFTMGRDGQRMTRGNAHPLSLKKQRARLEVRRNFFSQRVVDDWNTIPAVIKDARSVTSFKRLYGAHRDTVGTAA